MLNREESSPFPLPSPSDTEFAKIVERAQTGEEGAFASFLKEFEGRICSFLKGMVGDEDTANYLWGETTYRAWESLPSTNSELRLQPRAKQWLYTIATNLAKDYIQSLKRLQTVSIEYIEQQHETGNSQVEKDWQQISNAFSKSAEDIVCEKEYMVSVNTAMNQISPQYQRCFYLKYVQGFPHRDIAQKLVISESCSRAYAYRGRQEFFKALSLRKMLGDEGEKN